MKLFHCRKMPVLYIMVPIIVHTAAHLISELQRLLNMPVIYQQIIGLLAFNQACQTDIVSVLYNGPFLIPEIQSLLSMPAIYQLGLVKVQKAEFFPSLHIFDNRSKKQERTFHSLIQPGKQESQIQKN